MEHFQTKLLLLEIRILVENYEMSPFTINTIDDYLNRTHQHFVSVLRNHLNNHRSFLCILKAIFLN